MLVAHPGGQAGFVLRAAIWPKVRAMMRSTRRQFAEVVAQHDRHRRHVRGDRDPCGGIDADPVAADHRIPGIGDPHVGIGKGDLRGRGPVSARGPIHLCLMAPDLPGEVEMLLGEQFPVSPQIKGALRALPGVLEVQEF